jgi:DNA-binding SARP family transcriptional activator
LGTYANLVEQLVPSRGAAVAGLALEFRFLGGFSIRANADWHDGPAPKRGRELLQFLGAYPRRVATHDALAEAFWPDVHVEDVGHRIHLAASGARGYLRGVLSANDVIRRTPGGYTWDPSVQVSSDVDDLLRLCRSESTDALESARAVYGGEFLAGEPALWVRPLRIRCANAYGNAIEQLAHRAVSAGEYSQALAYGLELMESDPAHEAATRLTMRCFAVLGQRARAIECFNALHAYLQRSLGIEPAPETLALALELRKNGDRRVF